MAGADLANGVPAPGAAEVRPVVGGLQAEQGLLHSEDARLLLHPADQVL